MDSQFAVDFPGTSRVHIALAVTNLKQSRAFYETLLGVSPTKERPGYVKFEPREPSVNLTLNQAEFSRTIEKPATHYGVQVKSTQDVQDAIARLSDAGLQTSVEKNTSCCYSVQDKVWVSDPDENQWEVFVVLEADADQRKGEGSTCCAKDSKLPSTTCC